MRNILPANLLIGALLCAAGFAQSASPSSTPSTPQAPPPAQSEAQPQQPQQPEPQSAPQPAQTPAASANSTSGTTAAAGAPSAANHRIAPGSVIPVELTKTIDAKKVKAGDPVVAKVTMDLKSNSGQVILPKDTKVMGHVTEAQARSKDQKQSQVGIAFDRAMFKDGETQLPMSIQAVIAPPSNNSNGGGNDQAEPATGGSAATSPTGGRNNAAGAAPPASSAPNTTAAEGAQAPGGARPPITGNTQGVVGISNLKLEAGQNAAQGSVLTSEKNNVKVESGTMLLLRVNQ
jgi:hypothetical protein